ncbi:disulfide bond formation protein DsbA [Pseudoxanthomonas broegbernensis]|uniref:Thiol:disulfide interchange protein n=1 Tax=Pseudoxanthomonas broegbernensis TaxID=83619 RepID=A0A7V8GNI6_9GAMM|nr:thiol:disulfide interchange protein DsbA/DsbL [Pseudoxanthomonas broegbernensis]KAF1687142.1 disulfide bond formation protein DsbA [Pseudoxanthomonas broegbernensis]MBB6065881.1 thiol:disulfide interchange protein DsbA [Pseudoxanthomonas broegbernensis]
MKSLIAGLFLAALAWLPAAHAADTPQAGRDYVEIDVGPWAPKAGRIEVAEVFGYTCPHCAHFEPMLRQWKAKLPPDVDLVPVPAAFGGGWDAWARAYFAAQRLGVAERTHQAVFDALHRDGTLPRNATAQELAGFYANHGVDPERFRAALADPQVDALLRKSAAFVRGAGLGGTPTVIVNGRYRVLGERYEDVLRTSQWLIARERSAHASTSR